MAKLYERLLSRVEAGTPVLDLTPDDQKGTEMQHVQQPSSSPVRPSVASRDVPKSPKQPTERRLDEEALSRMDDEGGSNDLPVNPPGAATNASGD